ncbi:DUF1878 family protein [Oceanobacillus saliphilus]|uniref:DUF1878 family protein n=1 Tax=Oceanobacillus saliphilus TaxID=2925834 RepID=UPI00201D7E80|nr:DUF1878 family protein [Oceanobacillus saliphilus]
MERFNNSNDGPSFHIQLLSKIIDMNQYPLTKLIIENNITQEEYMELMKMIKGLNDTYECQKEEGFLDFSSLLIHFAGMLNEKLDPNETINALKKEDCFPELMEEFSNILEENEKKYRRK